MIFPPSQVVFGLLLLSIAVVLVWDIRYNPFGEDEDGIQSSTRKLICGWCMKSLFLSFESFESN